MSKDNFTVLRLIIQGQMSSYQDERNDQCCKLLTETCLEIKDKVSAIQTMGGFLFDFQDIRNFKTWPNSSFSDFKSITEKVEENILNLFTPNLKTILKEKTDFLTLGIDVYDNMYEKYYSIAELVGTYDTKNEKILYWTGKSYPTPFQINNLIHCPKLETHLQQLNDIRVLVLGCHDLNMFSPRSRKSTKPGTDKDIVINEMQHLCDLYKPQVVLHHPHTTDTPKIWNLGWVGVRRFLPEVSIYSSGIHYYNEGNKPRSSLRNVLNETTRGNVMDIVFNCSENGGISHV